jgi:hypothetical protein
MCGASTYIGLPVAILVKLQSDRLQGSESYWVPDSAFTELRSLGTQMKDISAAKMYFMRKSAANTLTENKNK